MATKLLYALALPDVNQDSARGSERRNQAESGTLGTTQSDVQSISLNPGENRLSGGFVNEYAEFMAREFEELFASKGIEVVPYTLKTTNDPEDGYYTLRDIDARAEVPAERRVQRFEGAITRKGDRSTHYRSVETTVNTVDNPFGSATTAELGVDDRASKQRWMDPAGNTVESATVARSVDTEHGTVEFYDATNSTFDNPTLLYDIPLADEWRCDARVWDDKGRAKEQTVDGVSGITSWQRVYRLDHNFDGNPTIETDHLRLEIDLATNTLTASRWDQGTTSYSSVSLGSTTWQIFDYKFQRIGAERVDVRMEFEDTNSDSFYRLDAAFRRGRDSVLFAKPSGAGSIPNGLDTHLDPIAADSDRDPTGRQDITMKTAVSF